MTRARSVLPVPGGPASKMPWREGGGGGFGGKESAQQEDGETRGGEGEGYEWMLTHCHE